MFNQCQAYLVERLAEDWESGAERALLHGGENDEEELPQLIIDDVTRLPAQQMEGNILAFQPWGY
jgi:hypothetical protein